MKNMWVVALEKEVDGAELPATTVHKWPKHCIFRVPPHFKVGKVVFKPKMVALGPFHNNDAALRPMEEHKLRAVRHLLRRSGKSLGDLAAAMEGVAADLEDAYGWRGKNRDKFLKMMILDGCFLLEFMRNYTREKISGDYSANDQISGYSADDPVFGPHAVKHIALFVHRDMLLIENQLPLILLRTIVAVETGQTPNDFWINQLVLDFLCLDHDCTADVSPRLGLHPLHLYHQSLVLGLRSRRAQAIPNDHQADALPTTVARGHPQEREIADARPAKAAPPRRSAQKLYEAGIRFEIRNGGGFEFDMRKRKMKLEMPRVLLDDSSEYKYRNLMAFEALHAGAGGNEVTAFVLFMRDLVDSTDDVELLRKEGVLDHDLAGGDQAVVSLLNRLTRDVAKIGRSGLCNIRRDMESYCVHRSWAWRVRIFRWWSILRASHLSNIWTIIGLLAAVVLLCTNMVQTVFSVKSYYK